MPPRPAGAETAGPRKRWPPTTLPPSSSGTGAGTWRAGGRKYTGRAQWWTFWRTWHRDGTSGRPGRLRPHRHPAYPDRDRWHPPAPCGLPPPANFGAHAPWQPLATSGPLSRPRGAVDTSRASDERGGIPRPGASWPGTWRPSEPFPVAFTSASRIQSILKQRQAGPGHSPSRPLALPALAGPQRVSAAACRRRAIEDLAAPCGHKPSVALGRHQLEAYPCTSPQKQDHPRFTSRPSAGPQCAAGEW